MVFTAKGARLTLRHADGRVESLKAESPFAALRELLARVGDFIAGLKAPLRGGG